MSYAITIVQGNAGKDAEMKYGQNGTPICRFSVAVSNGKDKDSTWYNVTCFNKTAEIAAEQIRKGTPVMVVGQMQSQQYEGKTYWNLIANRVQAFNGGSRPGNSNDETRDAGWDALASASRNVDVGEINTDEDEIPF